MWLVYRHSLVASQASENACFNCGGTMPSDSQVGFPWGSLHLLWMTLILTYVFSTDWKSSIMRICQYNDNDNSVNSLYFYSTIFFFFLIFIEYWLCACPCSKHLSYLTFFNTKNNSMKLIIIIPILQKKRLSYGISYAPSQSEQQIFISQIHLHKFVNQMSLLGP